MKPKKLMQGASRFAAANPSNEIPSGAVKAGVSWFAVQFILPVNNPVNNVVKRVRKGGYVFEVPINTPDIHKLTYADLLVMAEEAELSTVSTALNKTALQASEDSL